MSKDQLLEQAYLLQGQEIAYDLNIVKEESDVDYE